MNEKWGFIPRSNDLYEVSTLGRVRSTNNRHGKRKTPSILKTYVEKNGYVTIQIKIGLIFRKFLVHRLVLETFKEKANGRHANHINFIRHDNSLENLEWVSVKENVLRSYAAGRHIRGEKQGLSKLLSKDVLKIKHRLSRGTKLAALSKEYGVTESTIS